MERELEPARALAIETEDAFLLAVRTHRGEWLEALAKHTAELVAKQEQALDDYRQATVALLALERTSRDLIQLGDPTQIRRPHRANEHRAILDFCEIVKLDGEDEQRLADLRWKREELAA